MAKYEGRKISTGWEVTADGKPLPKRLDLVNHSPDGFAWGYGGSGPAQLSIALVAHATQSDRLAQLYYQSFKDRVVALLDSRSGWSMTSDEVRAEVYAIRDARTRHMGWGADDVERLS